jgi:NAD(P)-dependent dehydrogenase (short-subunit alcohol dehydrogenase family)
MVTQSCYSVFGLAGKRAIVTGAAQGFGASITRLLVQAGAHVIVADRNVGAASDFVAALTARQMSSSNEDGAIPVTPAFVDVADEASVAALFDSHPNIDLLVNNAGVFSNFMAVDLPAAEFDRIMAVNVRGAFLCAREFARQSRAGRRCRSNSRRTGFASTLCVPALR